MTVLVLGGYGAVGAQIVNGLRASGGHAIAAGAEDPELVSLITEAGAAVVDITATASYVAALQTLTWLPGGSRAPRLHLPGSDRWLVLAQRRCGGGSW